MFFKIVKFRDKGSDENGAPAYSLVSMKAIKVPSAPVPPDEEHVAVCMVYLLTCYFTELSYTTSCDNKDDLIPNAQLILVKFMFTCC